MPKSEKKVEQGNNSLSRIRPDKITEATFRNQSLSTAGCELIIAPLVCVTALDLSQNNIDSFPCGLPHTLLGLDLSHNRLCQFSLTPKMGNLIELRLKGNQIASTTSLSSGTNLRHLDLSSNRISRIEGLECLVGLETLLLESNCIGSALALRALSFNRCFGAK